MTVTCSNKIIAASERIFGFNLTHTDWPSVKDMANRKQSFLATYTPAGIHYIYNVIDNHLGKDASDAQGCPLPDKMMYYGNSRTSEKGLATKIEKHLDSTAELSNYDVLVIHGHQSQEEISAYLKHFASCNGNTMHIKFGCATSGVANAGIDCKDIWFVIQIDSLPSIWDLAQKMGRAHRGPFATGNDYKYFLFFSLPDLIYLFK